MKDQWVVASHMPCTGDLARNPGMCSDWGLNRRPFAVQRTLSHTSQGWRSFFTEHFRSKLLLVNHKSRIPPEA